MLVRWVALAAVWIGFVHATGQAAESTARIQGLVYISSSGDLDTPWIIFGTDVVVSLLRDDGTFDQKLKALRGSWTARIKAQEKVARQAYDRFLSSKTPRERVERASILKAARAELERLKAECRTQVDALIAAYRVASTKADGEGKFAFQDVARGRYLLHAAFEILRTDQWYYWLLPVDVAGGVTAEVQLKKGNSVALYAAD